MSKLAYFICISSLIIATVTLTGITGCESSDDDGTTTSTASGLTISPASQTLDASLTNTIAFIASGGASNYSWSVNDSSLGTLTDSGDTAIYTSTTNVGMNFVTITDDSNDVVTATITQE